jgi:hypothetical protein
VEEARKEYAEALQIYQPFAKQDPQRFSADCREDKEAAGTVTEIKLSLSTLPNRKLARIMEAVICPQPL